MRQFIVYRKQSGLPLFLKVNTWFSVYADINCMANQMIVSIDTNIVFSALLNKNSPIADVLLNSPAEFEFYTCEYLKEEITLHKDKIIKLSKHEPPEIEELLTIIYSILTFFPEKLIPFVIWQKSAILLRGIDTNDVAFVALSQFLEIDIWTGDKQLIKGLQAKGFEKVIGTKKVLALRSKKS